MFTPGVAAGHPATVEIGLATLDRGGNAADSAVAATLASCVAETVMTGLGGGGFATYFDATSATVHCLDFFVDIPQRVGDAGLTPVEISFGGVPLEFCVGASSVAVPGVVAGCGQLHRRFGDLSWPRVVEPAARLAARGVRLPPQHLRALRSVAPALLSGEGTAAYAPAGRLLRTGQWLYHRGLSETLHRIAQHGPGAFYAGPVADAIVKAVAGAGGGLSHADLDAYRVRDLPVAAGNFAGHRVLGRDDLASTVSTLAKFAACADWDIGERAVACAEALATPCGGDLGDTTNLAVVDGNGNACAVTTTLGLGSGIWPAGTGIHLNSMLGEGELRCVDRRPGQRMASMMCPLVALDGQDELALAIGSAGASRIRSALVHTLTATLADGIDLPLAVSAPRFHPVNGVVHAESGLDNRVTRALRGAGYQLRTWDDDMHYFGGVTGVGKGFAVGDIRRGGTGALWPRRP